MDDVSKEIINHNKFKNFIGDWAIKNIGTGTIEFYPTREELYNYAKD